MKKVTITYIVLLLFLLSPNLNSQSITIFTDGFDNFDNISKRSNIKITNISGTKYICLSNSLGKANGYTISSNIVLFNGYNWEYLIFDYSIIGSSGNAFFYIDILKSDNTVLINDITNEQYFIGNITFSTIKLKAKLAKTPGGNKRPILEFWKITAAPKSKETKYEPVRTGVFYGAPAPLKIKSSSDKIRFYYKLENNCWVTLKIYNINYKLVKIVQNEEYYSAGSNLDASWDGKNGIGQPVISGVYVAILEIKNENGDIEKLDPFSFAVIR